MVPVRPVFRALGKWGLRLILALLVLAALYLLPVLYPTPLFAHQARFGDYRVYSDEPIPGDLSEVVDDAARRLAAMEHVPERSGTRIYLCGSRKRYAFFAFLTRKNPDTLAIGLAVANEMFVSMSRVREFRERNRGRFRHTRFEGNLAEVIAHEIAHFNSVQAMGYRPHLAQPVWKSEGWAEYQANLAAIRGDPSYDLRARIDLLLDDRIWSGGTGVARDLWEWQLLVEFLGELKGYRLAELVRDEVTLPWARRQMMAWYRLEE